MTTALLRTADELHARVRNGLRAVVMTMGALHEGHATLIRTAREIAGDQGEVVVTVFVNPLQFGKGEDLDRYPRTLDADLKIAEEAGADAVFAPSVDEVYPGGEPQVRISAGPMGERLEGATRPGHFDGMLTVVAKLLHLTRPDMALFGQKDAQQLALIRRMARDLNFGVEIVGVPTVREEDGLALSSRNRYLSPQERRTALALSGALFAGRDRHAAQEALRARAREVPATRARAEALSAIGESRAAADAHAVAKSVPGGPAGCPRRGPPRPRRGGAPAAAAGPGLPGTGRSVRLHRGRRGLHRRGGPRRRRPGREDPPDRQHPPHLRSRPVTGKGTGTGTGAGTSTGTGIRLHAPAPGWALTADVVVVGSGVAGLTAALRCEAAGLRTVVVTKARLDDGSTRWAQGGIAAALGEGDTPEQHLDDTLVAGAGLCDEEAVRILVTEGPDAVRRLIATGAHFDESAAGDLELTREGGHHRRRIAHAAWRRDRRRDLPGAR